MNTIIIDVFQYTQHIGAILLDHQKRLIVQPNGEENRVMLENLIGSAQRRIPGSLSNTQLLLKLPDYYNGVVYAELRAEQP